MAMEQEKKGLSTADLAGKTQDWQARNQPMEGARQSDRPSGGAWDAQERAPLFSGNEGHEFRNRWDGVQASFVDEPRRAVEQADQLVAEVMKRLAAGFADERSKLEHQWTRGDDVSTEELRIALRRYRSFFDRLLSV
jgi:hypothetical protein